MCIAGCAIAAVMRLHFIKECDNMNESTKTPMLDVSRLREAMKSAGLGALLTTGLSTGAAAEVWDSPQLAADCTVCTTCLIARSTG